MKIFFKSFLLFILIFLAGCSVTKRRYMPGYSVQWNNNNIKTNSSSNEDIQNLKINKSNYFNNRNALFSSETPVVLNGIKESKCKNKALRVKSGIKNKIITI